MPKRDSIQSAADIPQKPYFKIGEAAEFCDYTPITPTCAEPASFGESCSSIPCGEDLFCDSLNGYTCKYKFPDGQTCTTSTECLSGSCLYDGVLGRYYCGASGAGGVLCIGR